MPKNPDGCQPSSYQYLSIDLVALWDFDLCMSVKLAKITIYTRYSQSLGSGSLHFAAQITHMLHLVTQNVILVRG